MSSIRMAFMMAAVAVALVLWMAASASATPHSTTLTARAEDPAVKWGTATILSAVLMDTEAQLALGGQWVDLEYSPDGPGDWQLLYPLTTDDAAYASGEYSAEVAPTQTTYYHFVFAGTDTYARSTSIDLVIAVIPLLGRPSAPRTARAGRSFSVTGTLKPGFPAGAKTVRIKFFRLKAGKWVNVRTYSATNSDYETFTKYRLKLRLMRKGKYRCRATTSTSRSYAAARSSTSRTIAVK